MKYLFVMLKLLVLLFCLAGCCPRSCGQITIGYIPPTDLSFEIQQDNSFMNNFILADKTNIEVYDWNNIVLFENPQRNWFSSPSQIWTLDYLGGDAEHLSTLQWGGFELFKNYNWGTNQSVQITFEKAYMNRLLNVNENTGSVGFYTNPNDFKIYESAFGPEFYILAIEDLRRESTRDWNDGVFLLTISSIPEPSSIVFLVGLVGFFLAGKRR